jgi:UDP-N-acetyl-D-glucosamine dehydrogenase
MTTIKNSVIAIIGQGYVGLPLAIDAAGAGWTVVGIDQDLRKVNALNRGISHVEDVSDMQLKSALAIGSYKASIDFSEVSKASIIVICVPTPLGVNREPDLNFLESATKSSAPYIADGTTILNESTSYPGTLRNLIIPIVNKYKQNSTKNVFFASSPERVNPGNTNWNQKNTPRLLGAIDFESRTNALVFYESICDNVVVVSSPEVAEAAKLLENCFRLVNIALVNEFSQILENTKININEVIDAASTKPYGFMEFRSGSGVGGHCIPVDPFYLTWWANQNGKESKLVETAGNVNSFMPFFVANKAFELASSKTKNPRILILGVAYKSGISDVRETPANAIRNQLISLGAQVAWYDPLVSDWEGTLPVDLNWSCDLAVLSVNQPGLDIKRLLKKGVQILDCTNSLKPQNGVFTI